MCVAGAGGNWIQETMLETVFIIHWRLDSSFDYRYTREDGEKRMC